MMTLMALWMGNSPVTGEFPAQSPVTLSFDVFFDLRLNKQLRKQSWGWWFQTPSRSLWRHCNVKFSDNNSLDEVIFCRGLELGEAAGHVAFILSDLSSDTGHCIYIY